MGQGLVRTAGPSKIASLLNPFTSIVPQKRFSDRFGLDAHPTNSRYHRDPMRYHRRSIVHCPLLYPVPRDDRKGVVLPKLRLISGFVQTLVDDGERLCLEFGGAHAVL